MLFSIYGFSSNWKKVAENDVGNYYIDFESLKNESGLCSIIQNWSTLLSHSRTIIRQLVSMLLIVRMKIKNGWALPHLAREWARVNSIISPIQTKVFFRSRIWNAFSSLCAVASSLRTLDFDRNVFSRNSRNMYEVMHMCNPSQLQLM